MPSYSADGEAGHDDERGENQDRIRASIFRGCAFANTVAEIGTSVPSITDIALRHKQDVRDAIAALLPTNAAASDIAWAATLALDGAIVTAQLGGPSTEAALLGLRNLLHALAYRCCDQGDD